MAADQLRRQQGWIDFDVIVNADHEQAWTRLRHEQRRIDDERAKAIAGVGEGSADGLEIATVVRGRVAADIFDCNDFRRAAIGDNPVMTSQNG